MKLINSIRTTFNAIFGAIIILLIIIGISTIFLFEGMQSSSKSKQNRYLSKNLANELRQSSDDLTRFARLYVTTGDPKYEQYYENVLGIRNGTVPRPESYDRIYWDFLVASGIKPRPDGEAKSLHNLMKEAGFTEDDFAKLDQSQSYSDALVKTEKIAMHAIKGQFEDEMGTYTITGPPDQKLAIQLMYGEDYQKEKAKIMKPIDEFFQQLNIRTLENSNESYSYSMFWLLTIVAMLILILLLTIFSYFIVLKKISNPIKLLSNKAQQIANGDLNINFNKTDQKDEINLLNDAFFDMVVTLRGSIKEIIEGINMLGSSSSEILAATSQVSASAIETATAINQTSTTVEEVRQASQLSSEKAGRVVNNAQETASVAHSGIEAVGNTKEVMRNVQKQMEAIAKTVVRLSEQSQQIGGIIASVNDIADQSTVLAVNAAIEASKAGEQGKGFTVVAQEIKNLSLQSKKATTQVRNILSDIQKATTAAVMSTEQGTKAVSDAVNQSTHAGDTIQTLSERVNEFLQAAAQIVASSQQQVVGMDQVGLAMNSINQAGAENAASMKQAENSAKDLNLLGIKLKQLVDQYKM